MPENESSKPYTQEICDRIVAAINDYLAHNPYLSMRLAMKDERFQNEDPVDVAVTVGKMAEAGLIDGKYKFVDSPELYTIDELINSGRNDVDTEFCILKKAK